MLVGFEGQLLAGLQVDLAEAELRGVRDDAFAGLGHRRLGFGFEVLEVDGFQAFLDMQVARLAVQAFSAPVIDSVGGV